MEKRVLNSWQGWLLGRAIGAVILIPVLRMASYLVKMFHCCHLEFIIFEQGILHFHLALGPTNYTASSASFSLAFPLCCIPIDVHIILRDSKTETLCACWKV